MANANYSVLSGIMDILKAQEVKKQQAILNQQHSDKQIEEKRQFNQQLKLHQAQFDEQVKHNNLATKAADAMRELEIAKQRSELSGIIQKGGTVPGTTSQPVATSQMGGDFTPMNPGQVTEMTHTLPIKDSNGQPVQVRLPTPEAYYANQAHFDEILKKPERDFELKKQEEAKKADEQRVLAQEQQDTIRAMLSKQYDDARNTATINAQNDRDRLNRESRERIARARLQATQAGRIDLDPFIKQGTEGTLSVEDVNKLQLSKQDRVKLVNAINTPDNVLLRKDQVTAVDQLTRLVDTIKYMDKVIANKPKSDTKWGSIPSGAISNLGNTNLDAAIDELDGHLSSIARKFGDEKGPLTEKDVGRAKVVVPGRYTPTKSDITKRNDYVNEINQMVDSKLKGLPQSQINRLKLKIGLLDYGQLDKNGQPIQSKPTQPTQNSEPQVQFSPAAQELLKKHKIQ